LRRCGLRASPVAATGSCGAENQNREDNESSG